MDTKEYAQAEAPRPSSLAAVRAQVLGRDDASLYQGLSQAGIDVVLDHLVNVVLPTAFRTGLAEGPTGVVQLTLGSPSGERHLSIARTEAGVHARTGHATNPGAVASMTLANLLRLLINEPGKDVATQLASKAIHVTGDEALVRAIPEWLELPA
jgi:hypothetical protein